MSRKLKVRSPTAIAAASLLAASVMGFAATIPGRADEVPASAEETYKDVEATLGGVPTFVKMFPAAGVAGAWAELRDLELSDRTELSPKVKALISLAVSAQIPCHYCVWADTETAKANGATEGEIAEAVAMSALTRHWSTFLNGMQVDFEQFKKEMGGEMASK